MNIIVCYNSITITLPKSLIEQIKKFEIDLESKFIDFLIKELKLNPDEEIKIRIELAMKYLNEGKELIDKDPVQASEKLYKSAEECVKILAIFFKYEDILKRVEGRGKWSVTDLEKVVERVSDRINNWFYDAWDHAWILHVWDFHEAKLDSEAIRRRVSYIERIVYETKNIVSINNLCY